MREIGEILHKAKSGRLIIRLNEKVDAGQILLDSKGRNAAKVIEMIGPVSKPYASAAPSSDRVGGGKDGKKLFFG